MNIAVAELTSSMKSAVRPSYMKLIAERPDDPHEGVKLVTDLPLEWLFVRSIASVMLESAAYLDGIIRPHADRGQQVAKTVRKKLCRDGDVAEMVEHIRGDGRTCEEWIGIRSALEPRQRLLARTRYRRIVPKLRREGMAGEMDEPI